MGERRGWAELLVALGGLTLVGTFFLPLTHEGWPPQDAPFTTAYQTSVSLRALFRDVTLIDRIDILFWLGSLVAPHAFGALVVAESGLARFRRWPTAPAFRAGLRCLFVFWVIDGLLLPVLIRTPGPHMVPLRVTGLVMVGILVGARLLPTRLRPAREHGAWMRRHRLPGSLVCGTWFAYLYLVRPDAVESTFLLSMSGALLVAIGSAAGLIARPTGTEPPLAVPPGPR